MILAVINVHKCDNCANVATVDVLSEENECEFRKQWKVGMVFDFCPDCKDSERAEECRKIEESASEEIARDAAPEVEYAN
jgi:hypothetical protein